MIPFHKSELKSLNFNKLIVLRLNVIPLKSLEKKYKIIANSYVVIGISRVFELHK